MKSTLEALWRGQIAPGSNCGVGNYEIEKLSILIDRNLEALNNCLDADQRDILKKYTDCTESYCDSISAQAFCDGFSLAAKLLAEALSDPS